MDFTAEISPVSLPELRTRVDEVLSTGYVSEAEAAFGRGRSRTTISSRQASSSGYGAPWSAR